jgi:hypothetical protein
MMVVIDDDLDFGIWDVAFEGKIFDSYGTYAHIVNKSMEDLGYVYLHSDLLNMSILTIVTLRV